MIKISKEQIIKNHDKIINITGGSDGLRDEGMLESALASAFQTFGGSDLYPSLHAKIARITCGIIRNHPFVDGNKRIGMTTMRTLLEMNYLNAEFTDNELVDIGLDIANGKMNDEQLSEYIREKNNGNDIQ